MLKTKTAASFVSLVVVLLGCSPQNIPLASVAGVYDDGLLTIEFNDESNRLEGNIYQEIPALGQNESGICDISFISLTPGELIDIDKEIKIIAQAKDDENSYNGVLVIGEKKVEIQFDTPIFPCQRVIDLNGGETFFQSKI